MSTVQYQSDTFDGGNPVDYFAPHLDVKICVACFTLHGCNMVTGGGKLIENSVKGLPVVISPSCAHLADGRPISCNKISTMLELSAKVNFRFMQ